MALSRWSMPRPRARCAGNAAGIMRRPRKPQPKFRLRQEAASQSQPQTQHAAEPASPILRKFENLWPRQQSSQIECFECKAKQEVSSAARSTICPACSAHIDLQDYKITTSFSRSIRTHGEVHITSRADLSSNTVICRTALIEGKLRGTLHCSGAATINFTGKIPGRLTAAHVVVERKSRSAIFPAVASEDDRNSRADDRRSHRRGCGRDSQERLARW